VALGYACKFGLFQAYFIVPNFKHDVEECSLKNPHRLESQFFLIQSQISQGCPGVLKIIMYGRFGLFSADFLNPILTMYIVHALG